MGRRERANGDDDLQAGEDWAGERGGGRKGDNDEDGPRLCPEGSSVI